MNSEFLKRNGIQPKQPDDTENLKQTYLIEANSMWKQNLGNERSGPGSLNKKIFRNKNSDKLCKDKGQGKF